MSDYVRLAKRSLGLLIVVPLALATAGFLTARGQAKVYQATAEVLLRPNDPNERVGTSGGTGTEILYADRIVQAQANIARGASVRDAAAAALGGATALQLEHVVTVTPASDSNILSISAKDVDPQRATVIANAIASAFLENRRMAAVEPLKSAIQDLDEKIAETQRQIAQLGKVLGDPSAAAELDTAQGQYRSLSDRRLLLAVDKDLKRGEAELISTATNPLEPISPKPVRTAVLAAFLGLIAVAGGIVLKDRLDTRLRSRDDAEATAGLATLAELPFDRIAAGVELRVSAAEDPEGLAAEAIRSLRVSLRFLGVDDPVRLVLVTSALKGDGKSTVSANLAYSYAESGARTLLVSADLRRGPIGPEPSVWSGRGLVDLFEDMAKARELAAMDRILWARGDRVLQGSANIADYCQNETPNLWTLPAGRALVNPVEILGSGIAKDFFDRAAKDFDIVIIDSPPLLAVADAIVLSQFVDGVVVVTSLHRTPRPALARAMEVLRSGQATLLGLVVNRVDVSGTGYGYGSKYAYGTAPAPSGWAAVGAYARKLTNRRASTPPSRRAA
jgi:polysaccharide biosynthesis transport protein